MFYEDTGRPKDAPGFDAVLGNPPWEVLGRDQDQLTRFVRESGVYRTCGRGHLNLYQPFLERALSICRRGGRVGADRAVGTGGGRRRRRLAARPRQ